MSPAIPSRRAGIPVDPGHVVVGADRQVDVLVVVEDLELGLLRRHPALDGHLLDVVARPLPFLPRLVVEVPVDRRRLSLRGGPSGRCAAGTSGRRGLRPARPGIGRRGRRLSRGVDGRETGQERERARRVGNRASGQIEGG